MADLRFVSLHVSPWSERARWALDHHRLAYREEEHVVFFGEGKLRRITGKRRNTVPILVADGVVLDESWDIARYADNSGASGTLFPEAKLAEIERVRELVDTHLRAGRGLLVRALMEDDAALDASLPKPVPKAIRPLLRPIVRRVTRYLADKHGVTDPAREAEEKATIRRFLGEMRAMGLAPGRTVLGAFSYADVLLATALQGILPVADRHLRLPSAIRRIWTKSDLAQEFPDLIAWRDWVYDMYRRAQPS